MPRSQFSFFEAAFNRLNPFAPQIDRTEKLVRLLSVAIILQLAYSEYFLYGSNSRAATPRLIAGIVQLTLVLTSSILLIRHVKVGWYIAMFMNIYTVFCMEFISYWRVTFINKYYSDISEIIKIPKVTIITKAIINLCIVPTIIGGLIFWILSLPKVRKRLKINNVGYIVTVGLTVTVLLSLLAVFS